MLSAVTAAEIDIKIAEAEFVCFGSSKSLYIIYVKDICIVSLYVNDGQTEVGLIVIGSVQCYVSAKFNKIFFC